MDHLQLRTRWTADPAGVKTYYAYLDSEMLTYPGWNATTTDKPALPVRRVLVDKEGRTEEVTQVAVADITFSDPPTGGETLTDQTKWTTWTKTAYDSSMRRSTVKAYHAIPNSGDGTVGTNYYETSWTYANDTTNLVTTVQVEDPEDGYRKTTFNAAGQKTKVQGTATESSGDPTSWKTLAEYYYDQSTPGTGSSEGGNGNLMQVKTYYGDSDSNSTSYTYDYRGRQIIVSPPAAPYTLNKYDNMGRSVATGIYSSDAGLALGDDPTTESSNRLGLSETAYDNRGKVYETTRWEINSNTGAKVSDLKTDHYHDRNGRTVATVSPGGGAHVTEYDADGSVIETQVCVDLGSTLYSSGVFDYSSDNKVIELSQHTLDDVGRVTETNHYTLEAGATSYINPDSIGTNVIQTKARAYHDTMGRLTQNTSFGTFPENGFADPMNDPNQAAIAAYNPGSPESRANWDDPNDQPNLVTTHSYDAAGRLETVTDHESIVTRYEYDDLGRKTAMIEDYNADPNNGLCRRTEYEYNGNGGLTKLIARDVGEYGYDAGDSEEDQVTQYVYGHGVNSHWVTEIRYPGSNGQASSAAADKLTFTYNHDGTVATRTDQNGSVITYDYDTLRRETHERVTNVGGGVDNAVLQIVTGYNDSGWVQTLTQRDSATKDAGTVVNEVKFSYDGLGNLTKDEQEHSGVVDGSTLSVQYTYDTSASTSNNYTRLSSITYPNSRNLYALYTHSDTSTHQDEIAGAFSHVRQWAKTSGDPNDVYVEYAFAGRNTLVGRKANPNGTGSNVRGNDTYLNYDPDTQDEYAGLDLFGRIVGQKVTDANNTMTRDDVEYASHPDGSPEFAESQAARLLGRSAVYGYDKLHRLTDADIGLLNSGRDDLYGEWVYDPHERTYTMDILGNITALDRKNSGTSGSESRSYNATNELTSRTVAPEAPRFWVWDDFTDNDTTGWEVADLNSGGGDGTWSAASGNLSCTGVISVTGAPDGQTGSILLVDDVYYQDVYLTCSATLDRNCDNAGLVFGYVDPQNYWVKVYSNAQNAIFIYEVNGGTWTFRTGSNYTITNGVAFTMTAEVRAGAADVYAGTVPAGQVGLWCGDSSDNDFDDFQVRDIAGPFEVDGRYFCSNGEVRVDNSNNNLIEAYGTDGLEDCIVRRGFRGDV